jgi:cellulose synthase/poly-beta-1,6-N-acetylglucosamine synthase-like glycosyltransferase
VYEIIVVDDGSTDETPEIVRQFPVKCLRQENRGPATARNNGAHHAQGEIILFTDADCVPQDNWVEEMLKPFDDPEVMAVKGAYRTNQKSLTARFAQIEFEERFAILRKLHSIDMVDTYSAGYRKSVFLLLGGFDQSFPVANNEDTELSYKMSKAGYLMVFNHHAIVYHLNHPDSLEKYVRLKFWRGYWRMVVYRRYPEKMFKDSYTPQTLKLQILFVLLSLAAIPLLLFFSAVARYSLVLFGSGFLLAGYPLTLSALRKDFLVGLVSPLYILLRAIALGCGVAFGFMVRKLLHGTKK